jgi:hypothetical protein
MTSDWRRLSLLPALLGFGVGILAACAAGQPSLPPATASVQPPPQPLAKDALPLGVPHPARKPTPPPAPGGPAPEPGNEPLTMIEPGPPAAASGPSAAAPASGSAAAAPPQVQELIGLDQSAATRLLGTAAERREEPPATIWRYKSANCELDLFFYLDLRSGRMRTLHYTFRGDANDSARRQNCLRNLASRNS